MVISLRAVYEHIRSNGGTVTVTGKSYLHTKIARELNSLPDEQLVRRALSELVRLGLIEIVKKTARVVKVVDPMSLSDQPLTRDQPRLPGRAEDTAEIQRLKEENIRLQEENLRLRREAQATPRVSTSVIMLPAVWRLTGLMAALWYHYQYTIRQAVAERDAARHQLADAQATVRSLEQSLRKAEANGPDLRLTAEVDRLHRSNAQADKDKRKLLDQIRELREELKQLERDADVDAAEMSKIVAALEEAEVARNTAVQIAAQLRGGRTLERHPLGCGHMLVVLVERGHNPSTPMTTCCNLELTEIVPQRKPQ